MPGARAVSVRESARWGTNRAAFKSYERRVTTHEKGPEDLVHPPARGNVDVAQERNSTCHVHVSGYAFACQAPSCSLATRLPNVSIIHNARAIVLTCTLLAAPGLVAASLPVARPAQNTPPSAGQNVSALPTPARAPEPAAAAPTSSRGPVLAVAETTQDGGTVEEGTTLHFQFKITNQGGSDLEITEVKPSCGCTVPHWDKL